MQMPSFYSISVRWWCSGEALVIAEALVIGSQKGPWTWAKSQSTGLHIFRSYAL